MEITHDYIDLETAKLLKEKGFNVPCQTTYNEQGEVEDCINYTDSILFTVDDVHNALLNDFLNDFLVYLRPDIYIVRKWIMLKYNIWISCILRPNFGRFHCEIRETGTDGEFLHCTESFGSPEEAELKAIKYCLNNLIDGNK